ncbi:MAG: hypothetical protein ACYTFG_20995, partial [Planctomycetota bacterium]
MGGESEELAGMIETLHPLEVKELLAFGEFGSSEPSDPELAEKAGITEAQHRRAVELLVSRDLVEKTREEVRQAVLLSDAGRAQAEPGLPEVRMLRAVVGAGTITVTALKELPGIDPPEVGPAVGALKKGGAIHIGEGGVLEPVPEKVAEFEELQGLVHRLASGEEIHLEGLEDGL